MDLPTEKIEYYIVKLLLESDIFLRGYANKITPDMFSSNIKPIINGIITVFKKTNKSISVKILEDIILPKVVKDNPSLIDRCKNEIENAKTIELSSNDILSSLKDDIEKFLKTRKILAAFGKALPHLENNEHDSVISIMEEAFKSNFEEEKELDYWDHLEERQERSKENSTVYPSGLPSLDKMIGGGYRKKGLFVFAGPPNVGKSLILNDAASNLSLQGFNVLYITLELAEDYISQRSDAKIGEYSMNELNVNPEKAIQKVIAKKKIMEKSGKKYGKLIYKYYPANTISCNDIRAYIKNYEAKSGNKFDFVIIDYLKLLRSGNRAKSDNTYIELGKVTIEMRNIAVEYDVCVLTATATDRSSMKSSDIGLNNLSDSIAIGQSADVVVTLVRDETLDKQNLMAVSCIKSRYSRNIGQFTAKVDYDFMRLLDISKDSIVNQKINDAKNAARNRDEENEDFSNVEEDFKDVEEIF